jgi:hypothetical protein
MSADFFLYTTEQLNTLACAETVRQGRAYFTGHRVIALEVQEGQLVTQVAAASQSRCYGVTLTRNRSDTLQCHCECASEENVCKHGIASLYRYAESCSAAEADSLGGAKDAAIKQRVKKGRNEVSVKLLRGNLAFGVWQAKSIISATYQKTAYQVYIRSLDQRKNYCTCPDLATNGLGTCKHIESVLHYAKKQPEYAQLVAKGAPISFVYLAWDSATDPVIRLHKLEQCAEGLVTELAEYFDAENQWKARWPDDFNDFVRKFKARNDLLIGDDVLLFVRQCAEDAAHQVRARHISQQIRQANGVFAGIKVRLFAYQTEGVAFLVSRGRALLADELGLGKTLQAIAAASWLAEHEGLKKVLVICPDALTQQWGREIEQFSDSKLQIIQGTAANRQMQYQADALFYIIDYPLILRDLNVITETLKPDLIILDEAERITNWRTKIASTVKLIPSRYVFVLTGSALEHRIEDLYSLLQLIDARVLGPLWRCLLDFHVTDAAGKVTGYRNLSELRRRMSSVLLRRERALVSDQLPAITQVCFDIPMTKVQREIHDAAMSNARQLASMAKRRALTPSEIRQLMAALQQARMAGNAAGLIDKTTLISPKLDELSRLLTELCLPGQRKVVVFSQWAKMTEMVESRVRSLGLAVVHLHGGLASHERGKLVDKFQRDDAVQVLISTDAGGAGLNLAVASALIHLDMPWNPAVLDQRIACVHGYGQQQKVQVFLFLAADAYEQRVAIRGTAQRDLFDQHIRPDGNEDVLDVSKKMLQSIIDELTETQTETQLSAPAVVFSQGSQEDAQADTVSAKPTEGELQLNALISKIQQSFAPRIEQILAAGHGLLLVLNSFEPEDDDSVRALSEPDIPVLVIAARTLSELQRLGIASPLADAKVIFEPTKDLLKGVNPLLKVAQDKLKSAEILIEQQCYAGVLEILVGTLLTIATVVCGQQQVPSPEKATVWLYSELLAQQLMSTEQINVIVKVIALSHKIAVSDALIEQALRDTQALMGQYGH